MDNNATLRSSLLYFVDEAIGYRHSLHFFHRWLITGEQSELEALIIEVGREHFVDLRPIVETINTKDNSGFAVINDIVRMNGLYSPKEWCNGDEIKLGPLSCNELTHHSLNEIGDWVNENLHVVPNPVAVICQAHNLLESSRTNFYKVFNLLEMLFGINTIFSCVINDSIKLFGNAVSNYYPKQQVHIKKLASAMANNLDLNWEDALSRNQIKSKLWLIEKLAEQKLIPKQRSITEAENTTLVVGGWVGMLPFLTSMTGKNLDSVINMDIDTSVHSAAHELNAGTHANFKNSGADVRSADLAKYKKLIVIDTIVEHFENHGEWVSTLPTGTTVVLQGNDMFDVPDHVNCHESLEEFIGSCGLNTILWSGELNLYKCTRYMAIGKV
jgi:hypothetical protein